MNPRDVYKAILEELANGEMTELQRKIFQLLRDHPEGLNRYELVFHIKGYWPLKVDGNTDDRKNRKAIEHLRKRYFPIVSTSGKPGYRLDITREAAEKMVAELQSRKKHLEEQISAVSHFYRLPTAPSVYQPPRRMTKKPMSVKQMEMML